MLHGPLKHCGYDWWWHSLTAQDAETGEDKAFFIEFFLCNPALAEDLPVLGQLPENREKGKAPSYLMVKAGCWGEDHCQLHRFFAWKDVNLHPDAPYLIEADDCLASETLLKGSIRIAEEEAAEHPEWMCDAGNLSWELRVDKQVAFNVGYGASKPLRDAEAFAMYWHAEGMKTAYSGTIRYNGREYIVTPEKSFGYADKNWGRDFTSPWVWLSSNCLKSRKTGEILKDSVFDIGGGRPKLGRFALDRKLLSAFRYEGREFEFNFSKFWTFCRTKFNCYEGRYRIVWHIEQRTLFNRMVTDISCQKRDMLLVNYESPDGAKRHDRLWNGGNGRGTVELYRFGRLVDRIKVLEAGCEWGEYASERNRRKAQRNKDNAGQ